MHVCKGSAVGTFSCTAPHPSAQRCSQLNHVAGMPLKHMHHCLILAKTAQCTCGAVLCTTHTAFPTADTHVVPCNAFPTPLPCSHHALYHNG